MYFLKTQNKQTKNQDQKMYSAKQILAIIKNLKIL